MVAVVFPLIHARTWSENSEFKLFITIFYFCKKAVENLLMSSASFSLSFYRVLERIWNPDSKPSFNLWRLCLRHFTWLECLLTHPACSVGLWRHCIRHPSLLICLWQIQLVVVPELLFLFLWLLSGSHGSCFPFGSPNSFFCGIHSFVEIYRVLMNPPCRFYPSWPGRPFRIEVFPVPGSLGRCAQSIFPRVPCYKISGGFPWLPVSRCSTKPAFCFRR